MLRIRHDSGVFGGSACVAGRSVYRQDMSDN